MPFGLGCGSRGLFLGLSLLGFGVVKEVKV